MKGWGRSKGGRLGGVMRGWGGCGWRSGGWGGGGGGGRWRWGESGRRRGAWGGRAGRGGEWGWKATRGQKGMDKWGGVKWAEAIKEYLVPGWIGKRANEAYGKTIDAAAAGRLAELIGPDLQRLDNELAKLAMY